ncbi:MAG: hypothetical protein CMF70_03860 [Magnetovibrio sp.]|nr:hypothetical protein [Magnetovibrio sp.]
MTKHECENIEVPVKVFWQPGCSSCLKTKEFLLEHGVPFQSINVLEDPSGFRELEAVGIRLVPIVMKGKNWANGAVFRDVAKVAGFKYDDHKMLPPAMLTDKVLMILNAVNRYLMQIPEESLDILLPGRPRSYRQLCYHVMAIPKVFLDYVEDDKPYTYDALISSIPADIITKKDLLNYGKKIRNRFQNWWAENGEDFDSKKSANVYYGEVSMHEVLERTAWHSGQHTRQIILMLKEKLHIKPYKPLGNQDFKGLPMPRNIWDNERSFNEDAYTG